MNLYHQNTINNNNNNSNNNNNNNNTLNSSSSPVIAHSINNELTLSSSINSSKSRKKYENTSHNSKVLDKNLALSISSPSSDNNNTVSRKSFKRGRKSSINVSAAPNMHQDSNSSLNMAMSNSPSISNDSIKELAMDKHYNPHHSHHHHQHQQQHTHLSTHHHHHQNNQNNFEHMSDFIPLNLISHRSPSIKGTTIKI